MKKQKIKKLISFDFDDTLFHTPLPEEGKKIWKQKTGKDWPHRGWWSKPESLDTEIFDIPINLNIYEKYERAVSDHSNYVILATGRIKPLEAEVFNILDTYNFNFDEIHLNPGIDTYEFKSNLFEKLINELQPEEFIMYDDRKEHLIRFVEWAKNMPCKVTLIDAISGKEFKSKEDKNLQEQISRIKEMMNINELGGDLSSFDERRINRYRESDPYKDKKYNPESSQDFSNSKVNKVVWRAGGLENFKDGGGLWFAENKEDVEKFALSVRGEKREGKPYYINLENPYYYRSFWNGYINDVGYSKYGREKLMYELMSDGHDGIIIGRDTWNDTGDENSVTSEQYVVFNPENVKPA